MRNARIAFAVIVSVVSAYFALGFAWQHALMDAIIFMAMSLIWMVSATALLIEGFYDV